MGSRRRSHRRSGKPVENAPAAQTSGAGTKILLGVLVVVAVAGLVVAALWSRDAQPAPPVVDTTPLPPALPVASGAASGFNVLLITLDTLRADRVGCYGYVGAQTPVLDGLAADGVRFADAVTCVPITLPAHASILTGQDPPRHGVRDNGTFKLVDEHTTLTERLKEHGYATAAFLGAFVLDQRFGVGQGFDVYDDEISADYSLPGVEPLNPQRPGNVVTDAAILWLDEHVASAPTTPFFAWVHLFDPHTPYAPPEPYRSRFAGRPYDGEIAFTDAQVGRFIERMRAHNLMDNTLIVAIGDHGEGLGDHGESTHALLIYGSTMRVPLIMHCPSVLPAGAVVADRVVSVVDIVPTVLDLLGLPALAGDGMSQLVGDADPLRAVYQETLAPQIGHGWSPLHGLRRHHDKYILAPAQEYYDLVRDPGELNNLWDRGADAGFALADALDERMTAFAAVAPVGDAQVAPDDDAIRKLAALGYVSGGSTTPTAGADLPNPKDMVRIAGERMAQASLAVNSGRGAEVIPMLTELTQISPGDAAVWSLMSVAHMQAGNLDESIRTRVRSIELQPRDASSWVMLADLQHVKGDVRASIESLDRAQRLDPDFGGSYLSMALHAMYAERYQSALELCATARYRDPSRYTQRSWSLQARIYDKMGRPVEAAEARRLAGQE